MREKLTYGYFLTDADWENASNLTVFQLDARKARKGYLLPYFNTINMIYLDEQLKHNKDCLSSTYFNQYIKNNTFLGLFNSFFSIKYTKNKNDFRLRDFYFLSLPMTLLYNSIGLYLVKITSQFLNDNKYSFATTFDDNLIEKELVAYYGGNLKIDKNTLKIRDLDDVYYPKYLTTFRDLIIYEAFINRKNRVITKLDMLNLSETINIRILLENIEKRIKPSICNLYNFDENTIRLIENFFLLVKRGEKGVPIVENSLISNYIAFLYLTMADEIVEEAINKVNHSVGMPIEKYKIRRYLDDIYIIIDFKDNIYESAKEKINNDIIYTISENLNQTTRLKINEKSDVYFLTREFDLIRLKESVSNISLGVEFDILEESKEVESVELKDISKLVLAELSKLKVENENGNKITYELLSSEIIKKIELLGRAKSKKQTNSIVYEVSELYSILGRNLKQSKLIDNEILRYIYNYDIQIFLAKNREEDLSEIMNNFDYENLKQFPSPLIRLILFIFEHDDLFIDRKNYVEEMLNHFRSKIEINLFDCEVLLTFLNRSSMDILSKYLEPTLKIASRNPTYLPIWNKFFADSNPGEYFGLPRDYTKFFDIEITEQIKLRRLSEHNKEFSLALNHLVNEFQEICFIIEAPSISKNKYNINNITSFLSSKRFGFVNKTLIDSIRRMFDRRNFNQISHGSSGDVISQPVSSNVYDNFKNDLSSILEILISTYNEEKP